LQINVGLKNLLLTLFTVLLASASFSQLSVTLVTPGPLAGTVASGVNNVSATVDIKNTGTTAIPIGDTIFYWISLDGGTSPITFTGAGGAWSIDVLSVALAPGATLTKTAMTGGFTTPPTTPTLTDVCLLAAVGEVAANGTGVASSCYQVNRSLVGINEKSLNEEVNIAAVYGVINMTSANQENYNYSVYSISGQVISQGSFVNNKEVNMTGVAKGIYAVVVTNGTEKITKKIAIQ